MAQSTKDEIIQMIKSLPDNVTVEDVMYHLYVKETILHRVKELDDGDVSLISEEKAQEIIAILHSKQNFKL